MKIFGIDKKISKPLSSFERKRLKILSKLSNYSLFIESLVLLVYFLFNIPFIVIVISALYLYFMWYLFVFIQKLFHKERPYSFFKRNFGSRTPPKHSFPSTHSMISGFYFMVSLLLINNIAVKSFAIVLSILVPLLRLFSLQHWISDVVIGFVFGMTIFYLWMFIVDFVNLPTNITFSI